MKCQHKEDWCILFMVCVVKRARNILKDFQILLCLKLTSIPLKIKILFSINLFCSFLWCWISVMFSNRGPWSQHFFNLLALTLTRNKISSWIFQHLFIKFLYKSACQHCPILAKMLEFLKKFSISLREDIFEFFKLVRRQPSWSPRTMWL